MTKQWIITPRLLRFCDPEGRELPDWVFSYDDNRYVDCRSSRGLKELEDSKAWPLLKSMFDIVSVIEYKQFQNALSFGDAHDVLLKMHNGDLHTIRNRLPCP